MKRTFAILNPVQFIPGQPNVMIPIQQVAPNGSSRPLEHIDTTRSALVTTPEASAALDAIEAAIVAEAQTELVARYVGDDIEVLTQSQWEDRQKNS
jgi:hypothetical protein